MPAVTGNRPLGSSWLEILRRKTPKAFAEAFAADATLEASVLSEPVLGADRIREVFAATTSMYESISFTHEMIDGAKTYLEWRGKAFNGLPATGITVLTHGPTGKIENILLMHAPLRTVETFSTELTKRMVSRT
jgi:hypothetical protein